MLLIVGTMLALINMRHSLAFVSNSRFRAFTSRTVLASAPTGRIASTGISLDVNLLASNPELVITHLKARRADAKILNDVQTIITLRAERNALIVQGDTAKASRNTLSQQIGMMMKQKQLDQVNELKRQVEAASKVSAESDEKIAFLDQQINTLFSVIPNLLDDRVPEGEDDSQNPIVHIWGEDKRKLGEGYLWHDELAAALKGTNMEAGTSSQTTYYSPYVTPTCIYSQSYLRSTVFSVTWSSGEAGTRRDPIFP